MLDPVLSTGNIVMTEYACAHSPSELASSGYLTL